ncbi:hypothetical protein CDD81_3705 [Ophiocordyceps australis]|uniref:Uncharacterized protein n=1 Tax=Ophiocordyceps australis TaxID=1399860 RepID=A0A2C5X754_9HYPO|nr:hypothetical protein CDD81_3705 [Ophiocordyceps australis]
MAASDESASIASEELSSSSSKSSSDDKQEASISAPHPSSLDKQLRRTCAHADALARHLYSCIQTRAGNDVVLMFICYASRLCASALSLTSRTLTTSPRVSLITRVLAAQMGALSSMISDTRAVGRLWGLLGLYIAIRRGAGGGGYASALAHAQIAALVVFQAAENVAVLGSRRVLPVRVAAQARLGVVSVRAWGVYVMLELVRLLVERVPRRRGGGEEKGEVEEWSGERQEAWEKSVKVNLAWAPLTVHWGVAGGVLADWLVSVLAMYPATGAMRDLWRETTG